MLEEKSTLSPSFDPSTPFNRKAPAAILARGTPCGAPGNFLKGDVVVKKKLVFLILAFAALAGTQTVSIASAEPAFCPLKCCIDGSACAHCCPGKPCNLICG